MKKYILRPFFSLFYVMIVTIFFLDFLSCSNNSIINISSERNFRKSNHEGAFQKEIFYYDKDMTDIRTIVLGELDEIKGTEIGIIDQLGMHILDENGKFKSEISFNWKNGVLDSDIITKKAGIFEIVVKDQSPYGLMDQNGNPIWSYNDNLSYNMAFGDTNFDGMLDFYIASNSLIKIDHDGIEKWQSKPGIFGNVEVLTDADQKKGFIVTSNHDGMIQFWDHSGDVVNEWMPKEKIHQFKISHWFGKPYIITSYKNDIIILDLKGNKFLRYRLTKIPSEIYSVRGAAVKFEKDREYFAIIAKFSSSTGLSMLCIFSPEKELVYIELLKVTTGLLALNDEVTSNNMQFLLVGDGAGKVNKYRLKK